MGYHNERIDADTVDSQEFWDEFWKITGILESELNEIADHLRDNDGQIWRRVFCRTFFAYLEGHLYSLQQLFLFYDWWTVDDETELKIRNQKIVENQDGASKIVSAYLPLVQNIKLLFAALAIASGIESTISKNDQYWEKLSKAVKVRNRVVHPKRSEDMTISDEEIALIEEVRKWYLQNASLLLKKRAEAYLHMIQVMEKAAEKKFGPMSKTEEGQNK